VGNGTDLGFFVHPTIAVNPRDKSFMGAIDLHFWDRTETENQDSKKTNSKITPENFHPRMNMN
jgi:hypothetical protein